MHITASGAPGPHRCLANGNFLFFHFSPSAQPGCRVTPQRRLGMELGPMGQELGRASLSPSLGVLTRIRVDCGVKLAPQPPGTASYWELRGIHVPVPHPQGDGWLY